MHSSDCFRAHWYRLLCCKASVTPASSSILCFFNRSKRCILQISSEHTGTNFSAVKHQSHQPARVFSGGCGWPGHWFYHERKNFIYRTSYLFRVHWFECTAGWERRTDVRVQTGTDQDFHLQSALVQASLLLKHQLTGQLTSDVIFSTKLVTWFIDQITKLVTCFNDREGRKCVLQNSRLLWFQSLPCRPGLVVGSGVCGQSEYCKVAG